MRWQDPWLWVLAVLTAVAQVFKVQGATERSSYNISWLLYGFALVSRGLTGTLFVILVAHLLEWVWHRYPWYIQSFNLATFIVASSSAWQVYAQVNPSQVPFHLSGALGLLAGLAVFTLLNHLLIGLVIKLARGQSFTQSGVFSPLTLMIDYSLIGMGASTALVWMINPFASGLSILPIYLIYSTLKVPALKRQSEIDPKTGLYNARFFAAALQRELSRADRFNRPLTVVLGDLDLLRNINNTYGHLAGDEVLIGIARILKREFREYDIVARFGGEEFAILMPETLPDQAFERIDSVRQTVETAEFEVPTSVTPIQATISFGIAGREHPSQTAEEIVHNADVSLYRAKLKGRNVTCLYSSQAVDNLFSEAQEDSDPIPSEPLPLDARTDGYLAPYQPNPLREKQVRSQIAAAEQPKPAAPPASRLWLTNAFIGLVVLTSVVLFLFLYQPGSQLDWLGIAVFGLIVLATEGLSIDIYVKDTSVSTSAAPFIAGALIFGPIGALVLSLILAATAMIKHRSQLSRFLFNSGNHLLSSSMIAGLIIPAGDRLLQLSPAYQLSLAMVSGLIVYTSSTVLVAGVMALSTRERSQAIWKERFAWLWPYYLAFGVGAYALILGYEVAGVVGTLAVLIPVLTLRFSQAQFVNHTKNLVSQLKSKNQELEEYSNEISSMNEDLLLSLSNVIDLRDTYTRGHSEFVSYYAVMMGRELGLPDRRLELLRKAGLLHDIGKIGIPDAILFKPGPLTDEEYDLVKEHPVRGAEIVQKNLSLAPIVPLIRHHHERMDGRGYPDGLESEEIPLEARILGVADAIEAMASDRPYRKALNFEEIEAELSENAGTQFDPQVVAAFNRVVAREGGPVTVNSAKFYTATSIPKILGRAISRQDGPMRPGSWIAPATRTPQRRTG